MKRVLFSFLMLAMLTPTLVCGNMMFEVKSAKAEPCHEQSADSNAINGIMFMQDCMGVDFQAASDSVFIQDPELNFELVSYGEEGFSAGISVFNSLEKARAPPDYSYSAPVLSSSAVILITQRFLI